MIAVLNIRDVKDGLPAAYRLLRTGSTAEAAAMIEKFLAINQQRKEKLNVVIAEIESRISHAREPIIFEGSDCWELNLMGAIASIICQKYEKPTFIYKKLASESQRHGAQHRCRRRELLR